MILGLLADYLQGELLVVVVLAYVVYQLWRGKSVLSGVVATVGTVATIAMSVFGVVVVAIILGWVDPDVGKFVGDVSTAVTTMWDAFGDSIIEFIEGLVS